MHQSADTSQAVIALIGHPNCGKTTLFRWLTGAAVRAVNYPGSTVDVHLGSTRENFGEPIRLLDTPGIQSLRGQSEDERVTLNAVFGQSNFAHIVGVIMVVDGTRLGRQLDLARQVSQTGCPLIVAVTMADLVREAGWEIDLESLGKLLGATHVVSIDGRLGGGMNELTRAMRDLPATQAISISRPKKMSFVEEVRHQSDSHRLATSLLSKGKSTLPIWRKRSDRLDQLFLHPHWGLALFFLLMGLLFSGIFWLADPLMGSVDEVFSYLAGEIKLSLGEGVLASFISDGVIASFAAVMVFVPQIFILFLGLSLLEESGYLARAAVLVDRPLARLGLSGRAFVSLLSGYACAVPAIMATRGIRSPRERWIASFIIPLLSCSARIPVYALLLSFIFQGRSAWLPGVTMAVIYLGSMLVAALAAGILNRLVRREAGGGRLLLELPLYRSPQVKSVLRHAWTRTKHYVIRAGPPIFAFALLLWLGTNFPQVAGQADIQASYLAQAGRWIEPIFQPLGLDWRVGVAMLAAFAAREVFVPAMAAMFYLNPDGSEETLREGLLSAMGGSRLASGEPMFTISSVVGLILFFMLALQCTSTSAAAWKETRSFRFAALQFLSLNGLAYMVSISAVQILRALGIN